MYSRTYKVCGGAKKDRAAQSTGTDPHPHPWIQFLSFLHRRANLEPGALSLGPWEDSSSHKASMGTSWRTWRDLEFDRG